MDAVIQAIAAWASESVWENWLRALIILLLGMLMARVFAKASMRLVQQRLDSHRRMLVQRVVSYTVIVLTLAAALHQLGFKLGVLLGAAGIVSVALGFAAQTSVSNIISGLFLVWEQPFVIGNIIDVGGTRGEVVAIDLLSVKLRTFDNLFVRIPNETLIKTQFVNVSRFPIRRIDIPVGVHYREHIGHVRDVLLAVARDNPRCLEDPEPLFIVQAFGASSVDLQFSVWTRQEHFLAVKTELFEQVKLAFEQAGIEIPFPQVSLNMGSGSGPIMIGDQADKD